MNLIDKLVPKKEISTEVSKDIITFEEFRSFQYSLLEYFANLCVDYISKQNGMYLTRVETLIRNELKYEDMFGYRLKRVQVKISDTTVATGKKTFISFLVPELIDGSFFYLNGSFYTPTIYVLDKPISVKKESIKLFGLFNSITIYTKDKLTIFMGNNIPLEYFLSFIFNHASKEELENLKNFETKFKIKKNQTHKFEDVLNYFANIFQCDPDEDKIFEKINSIFLDDYTKKLYLECYGKIIGDEINIKTLIKYAVFLSISDDEISFVDLSQKRMVFTELLLSPIFRKCSEVALRASKGFKADQIDSSSEECLKFFTNNLKSKFLYEPANLYSAIMTHKVSLINPGSENAPSSISSMHPTHYGRICPITISSQNPGETVSIVPGLKINKLGLFVDDKNNVL